MPRPSNQEVQNLAGPASNTRARSTLIQPVQSLHYQQVDQECTMSDALAPAKFKGKSTEDALRWLDQVESYLLFKKVEENQQAA